MVIKTSDGEKIKRYLEQIRLPEPDSHKGQNGKLLVIGGSSLFHSAVLWAAETASHFVDMVHFASTDENNEVMKSLKQKFRNGIIVPRKELLSYAKEDDVILIGNGMMRSTEVSTEIQRQDLESILNLSDEGLITRELMKMLLRDFPKKRFVIDAGALQMMDITWLKHMQTPAIVTPHQKEFATLFGVDVSHMEVDKKREVVLEYAKKYQCIILLKAVDDIISDGQETVVIEGGNAGLTKGGSGDVLAALCASFYTQSEPFLSAICASLLLKVTADSLFITHGYWYNTSTLIEEIPLELKRRLNSL